MDSVSKEMQGYKIYRWRYLVVFVFVFSGCANALVLLSWSPIANKANVYWNNIGLSSIDLLAVSFQIAYIPGTLLALSISKHSTLKVILLTGGSLTSFGCLIRWIGVQIYQTKSYHISSKGSYACVLIGTFIVALSQPFYLNLPAKIASAWYPLKERDIATTICSLANPLGSALGSLLSPLFVTGDDNDDNESSSVHGIPNLLLMQFLVAMTGLTLVAFFFRSEPPSPPSNTEFQKINSNYQKKHRNLYLEFEKLLTNPDYLKLFISFTIALGNLNALAALLGQLPGGYSTSQYGITGFILILSGFVGAFLTGILLERMKSYRSILQITWVLAVITWILFVSSCRDQSFPFLAISAGLLGFTLLPVIPASIMNAVECAYPVSEDLSIGVLYVGANTLAVAMTFLGQVILSTPEDSAGDKPLYPYAIWSSGTMVIGLIPVLFYRGRYHRLDQDLKALLVEDEENEENENKENSNNNNRGEDRENSAQSLGRSQTLNNDQTKEPISKLPIRNDQL